MFENTFGGIAQLNLQIVKPNQFGFVQEVYIIIALNQHKSDNKASDFPKMATFVKEMSVCV